MTSKDVIGLLELSLGHARLQFGEITLTDCTYNGTKFEVMYRTQDQVDLSVTMVAKVDEDVVNEVISHFKGVK